ncbi:DUF3311 domain-containing protein [Streptomyces sp. NPDC002896]|uniref:DUF3311 domain-containing protein n=1 Tax=Streptomyces sp. NPDC002896 TaxID=3154438 RepID=UPI003321DD12
MSAPPPERSADRPAVVPRYHLLWLLTPFVLYLGALPFVNRVQPVLLGLPFLFVWLLAATLLTPLAVWLTWRGDQRRRKQCQGRTQAEERTQAGGGRP